MTQKVELVSSIVGVHACCQNASFARAASGPTLAVSGAGFWVGGAGEMHGRSTGASVEVGRYAQ